MSIKKTEEVSTPGIFILLKSTGLLLMKRTLPQAPRQAGRGRRCAVAKLSDINRHPVREVHPPGRDGDRQDDTPFFRVD
ncbi:MAG: hypothetical protein MUP03_00425 [Anaerolineales bacterium]|nr:hypothetical protein [Anaerolineales bacterium]